MIDIQFTGKRKDSGKVMKSDSLMQTNIGTVCLWAPVGGWTEIEPESLRQTVAGVDISRTIDQLKALQTYCDGCIEAFTPNESLWAADVKALQTAIDILARYTR